MQLSLWGKTIMRESSSSPPEDPADPAAQPSSESDAAQHLGLSIVFTHLRAPLIVYGPIVVLAPIAASITSRSIVKIAGLFVAGFVFWSFFEYAVHRFIQHSPRLRPYIRRWDDHGVHHAQPNDPEGYVSSLGETLPIAGVLLGLFIVAAGSLSGGVTLLAGFLFGYLIYDWIHCASHLPELHEKRPWLTRWSSNHLRHHWERANAYYGFTTSLWDRLLGTYPAPKKSSLRRAKRNP